jgi:hypothetical protein
MTSNSPINWILKYRYLLFPISYWPKIGNEDGSLDHTQDIKKAIGEYKDVLPPS